MNRLAQGLKRHRSVLLLYLLRFLTYGGLMAAFALTMRVHNWQIFSISRTMAVTAVTYVTMTFVMNAVYGGYAVGKKKSKPVISSMSMAAILTDLVTYLQLEIMNVNPEKNEHLLLFGEDFPWLLICIAVQIVLIIISVQMGNGMYFKITPPIKCLLILGRPSEKEELLYKIGRYRLQWQVTDVELQDAEGIEDKIKAAGTVFLGDVSGEKRNELMQLCYRNHRSVLFRANLEDIIVSNARQTVVDDVPFLEMEAWRMTLGQRVAKRLMDIAFSAAALVLFSPVMLLCAIAIRVEDGSPALFRQKRITLWGRVFTVYKFRTMRSDASQAAVQQSVVQDDGRITRVGEFLRRTRLDELPQMWNILRGDMSLVGPRPEMLDNVTRYKQEVPAFAYREKMKAGLTGLAQIEGKYNTTPEDKLMLDLMYIESFSIWLDIKLLFRTLTVIFKTDSTEGFVSTPAKAADEPKKGEQGKDSISA